MGVPALHLCLTEDHRKSAQALHDAGAAVVLGVHDRVDGHTLDRAIIQACGAPAGRRHMAACGRRLVDGQGALRIAEKIATPVAPDASRPL